jgi:DNA-binding transcriptional MerR regulator
VSDRDYMTIGEVVDRLKPAFPDLSISKVRFLEEEGLIAPDRTQGGYRKFAPADVARVELILRLQKEHFLPLAVIAERLVDYDRGKMPPELRQTAVPAEQTALSLDEEGTIGVEDIPTSLGIPVTFVRELADFGLVDIVETEEDVEVLDRGDASIIHAAWDLRRFGVEPRHLRMYESFAEREAALFSQILMPAFRHRTPETRQKLLETLGELEGLTDDLKSRLLRRALLRTFEDLG